MRLVIDTDVVVAGLRSPEGASAALLVLLLQRRATMLLTTSLAVEYEATCLRAGHLAAAKLNKTDALILLDAIIDVIEPVEVYYQWRPQLPDADDDMVLEAAVNGHADAIVTFNRKDYGAVPSGFGIEVLSPEGSAEEAERMTTRVTTVPVRLPSSLKAAIEKLAAAEGISVNQFLVSAASEKLGAMQTAAAFFAERKGKGDRDAAIRILTRPGGEPPRPGDEQA